MNHNPEISILLPVFNAEHYLREAIKSLLNQTYGDFELIIIDDGSVDNSMNIASEFDDKRIRLFHKNHQGLIESLNFGIERAGGRWIARMDADDVVLPNRFKLQQEYLSNHKDVVAVGGAAYLIDSEGIRTGRCVVPPNDHDALLRNILYCGGEPTLIHPTVMMQSDAVKATGGYRKEFPVSEDTDLWLRLSRAGKLHSLSEPVLLLRKHNENVSYQKPATQIKSYIAAVVCHLVWQETGVDLITDMPEKWPICTSIIDSLIEKYNIIKVGEFKNDIAKKIREKTICGFLSASCSGIKHFSTFVKIFLGNAHRKVTEQAAEQMILIVRENRHKSYCDT